MGMWWLNGGDVGAQLWGCVGSICGDVAAQLWGCSGSMVVHQTVKPEVLGSNPASL